MSILGLDLISTVLTSFEFYASILRSRDGIALAREWKISTVLTSFEFCASILRSRDGIALAREWKISDSVFN